MRRLFFFWGGGVGGGGGVRVFWRLWGFLWPFRAEGFFKFFRASWGGLKASFGGVLGF